MENQVWICNVGQVILRQRQRKRKPRIRGWITQELHWRAHRSSDPDVHKNVWNWVLRYIYLKKKKKIQWICEAQMASEWWFPSGGLTQCYRWRIPSIDSAGSDRTLVSFRIIHFLLLFCFSCLSVPLPPISNTDWRIEYPLDIPFTLVPYVGYNHYAHIHSESSPILKCTPWRVKKRHLLFVSQPPKLFPYSHGNIPNRLTRLCPRKYTTTYASTSYCGNPHIY